MKNNNWPSFSTAELDLAKNVASRLPPEASFSSSNLETALSFSPTSINWLKPFAHSENEVTGNWLSALACALQQNSQYVDKNGVVITPGLLAEDMVKNALCEHLINKHPLEVDRILAFVLENSHDEELSAECAKIRWLDPCVGGGIFLSCILHVYRSLGIPTGPLLFGLDLNESFVQLSVARLIKQGAPSTISTNILVGDYLLFDAKDNFPSSFDIIIGNPPYVRWDSIDSEKRKVYAPRFSKVLKNKATDLYVYFATRSLLLLNEGGILTFVTPAQFQTSRYGLGFRQLVQQDSSLCSIVDFGELPVFDRVSVHTVVYSLSRKIRRESFLRLEHTALPTESPICEVYRKGKRYPSKNIASDGWSFGSTNAYAVLEKMRQGSIPLKNYAKGVYSGIKTGCKNAFFLSEKDVFEYGLESDSHCKKMVTPKGIKPWRTPWEGKYILIIKKDEVIPENTPLYEYLLRHRDELSKRTDIEGHNTWYGLRECAYYQEFEGPKIIFPDISKHCRFSLDLDGFIIPDGSFFIPGEDYYLLGLLNSSLSLFYFKQKAARIGNPKNGGRVRFKKNCTEQFPVPVGTHLQELKERISQLALSIVSKGGMGKEDQSLLDNLVMQLYELTPEEERTIAEALC